MNTAYIQAHIGKKLSDTNLTVLEDLGTRLSYGKKNRFFKVQCDCGNFAEYKAHRLYSGTYKTCGKCLYSKERRADGLAKASKKGALISGINSHKKAILIENKEHNFALLNTTYNEFKRIRKGIEWHLTPQDIEQLWIKQGGRCKQTGLLLTCGTNIKNRTWSLDRIDSTKHYTVDNVQIVSKVYNVIKRTNTDEQMKLFAYLLSQNTTHEEIRKFNNMTQEEINVTLKSCSKINKE